MKKAIWAIAIFSICNFLLADDEKLIGELLPGVSGLTKNKFAITPGLKGKIEGALGEKIADKEEFEIYSGKTKGGENAKAMLMVVKTATGETRLGVALVDTKIVAIKTFGGDNIDDFLKQFIGTKYPLENLEKDLSRLKTALQKANTGKDETAKEMGSLLKIAHVMQKIGDSYPELSKAVKSNDTSAKKYADELSSAYKEVVGATDNIKFLKKEDLADLKNIAVDTQTLFDKMGMSIEKGNFDMPKDELKTLSRNYCGKCHSSFLKSISERRASYDLGDGYFCMGHDIKPTKDEALSQAIATAIKKAAILILESK